MVFISPYRIRPAISWGGKIWGGLVDRVCSQQAGRHLLLEPFGAPSHETLLKRELLKEQWKTRPPLKNIFVEKIKTCLGAQKNSDKKNNSNPQVLCVFGIEVFSVHFNCFTKSKSIQLSHEKKKGLAFH